MQNLYLPIVILCTFLCNSPATAQEEGAPWVRYYDEMTAGEDDSEQLDEQTYEWLCQMAAQPIDLNTATREELEQLPFLTARQIEDLCEYRQRHGPLKTLDELIAIPSIDYNRRLLLSYFIYIGEPADDTHSLQQLLTPNRQQLLGTLHLPLYQRKGDRNGYLGYKYRHSLRYDFTARHLRMGLAAAQDSGEPFFAYKNTMGYDHYAYFVQLRQWGRWQNVTAGHFNAQFGMGLALNTGFSLGKAALLSSLGRAANGFRPSLSRSAASYFQGLAATVSLSRRLTLSAFASCRPHDATLNKDDGTIATIVKTGYHRTPQEMAKKNNVYTTTSGANLHYFQGGFRLGLTAVYTYLSRPLRPDTRALYRRHYPQGNQLANLGLDYGYTSRLLSVSGETATDRHGSIATVNSVALTVPYRLNIVLLHRYYSRGYTSLWGNSFSEGGRLQNEQGVYLGTDWKPTSQLRLTAYIDYAHFADPRYRVSAASDAFDTQATATLTLGPWTLYGRYRAHTRYWDNDKKTALVRQTTQRGRLSASHSHGPWTTVTQADWAMVTGCDQGYMLSQRVGCKPLRWLQLHVDAHYFHTDSYDSRLYTYEPGPLNSFGMTALSGHGLRCMLMARADLNSHLMLMAKTGTTKYLDRSTIGTGLQAIEGSFMTDLDFQLRWKF